MAHGKPRLPGELVQVVAPGLHTGKAFVGFGVITTLEGHWSRASQHLDAVGISIARAVIAPLGEQARSQAASRAGQGTPDLMILMSQKKGLNLLLVAGNLLDDDQQLFGQEEHQARPGAHHNRTGNQLRTMQFLKDLGRRLPRRKPVMLRQHDTSTENMFEGETTWHSLSKTRRKR